MLAAADPEEGNAPEVDEEKTNKRAPRPNNFFEIGVRGRKTGVKAPENVRLDENGMEMIEDWFKEEEPEGMDDLTVHEPADSGSIGTPKAAVSKAVPSPAPVSITPATDRAQNSATPEPARNAIYRLPRPSMIPPALSPTDEDSPHSSANTSHQFSMISNSSIVEEDIPSPRAILSPVRPFHLPTSGSMSSNANVSSSTSSKKSPATARETMRVPGRTVVQHSPPQRRVKEVVHSAQKPAQNSGRPPHPLMEMTTADTQDECFDAQENAESFGGAEETFGGEEVEAEEEALEEGPSASADYSADNLDVSMEPADIEADLEEEEQQAYDDMVENNQESVPSSPSRKRNEGNRKRKVISNDSDSDASNNDTTIRKKQQQQNGRSEAKVAAIPRRPQPSAKKLRLSDDRDRSRRGAEESEGEEAEQTPPAPTATLKKQSQSESARNSNKSSPLMSKRAEPKRQTRDKRVVRDPSTSNEEPANPHPEDDDVEEPETHGEPVASNRKAKQARPEAPSSKKTAATRTRKISEAVQHADHDDDDADDHDDNDEVEELETHREPVASTRKAKKQSRPEPTSSKTTAAKHGRKISEELQPADDESDDDDEQSFSQPLLGSGRNGADKGFRNGSGKNNERSARRNGWNDSDAHDDASANESTMEPEPQPEFDDMEQQDDHEDDVNGDVGHSADNASESDAGMQATSPVRSKPTATRKTVPSRSKALAAKQSGTSKTVAQKGKGATTRTKQPSRPAPPRPTLPESEDDEDNGGIRRSKRERHKPFQFWKGEGLKIARRESGGVTRELIRVDSDQEDHDRRRARTTASSRVKREHGSVPVAQPDIPVINIVTGEEEDQQIVATPEMLNPRNIGAGDYKFQKVFSEGNYIASGVLVMPKGSHKPNKNSAQSTMIFVVLSGKVEVQVNRTTFVVAKEATFMVPRGNQYRISNPFTTEARLYFCHGKEVVAEADTDT